jgi:acyl CoA:acetate/3-ketoacid CoA transferase beta subunit
VVDTVITDLGVFTIDRAGMTLTERGPGVALEEIRQKTEASFAVGSDLA